MSATVNATVRRKVQAHFERCYPGLADANPPAITTMTDLMVADLNIAIARLTRWRCKVTLPRS